MSTHRIAAIAAIAWSVLAVPAMCMGGVLEHACAPHESEDCGHEDQCADDPCATVLIRTEDGPVAAVDVSWAPASVELQTFDSIQPIAGVPCFHQHRSGGLPFPDSDVPLLI